MRREGDSDVSIPCKVDEAQGLREVRIRDKGATYPLCSFPHVHLVPPWSNCKTAAVWVLKCY